MFWTILHRTIFWELTRVFLLSLLGITGILLMAGIVAEASRHGLGPMQILAVIPLIVPSTLPYTIPATTLFATCVVYGRLAHDNEILAIRAAGVNILVVVWPAVLLGMTMTAVTVGLYYEIIPTTHYTMRSMVLNDVEEFLYALLRQDQYICHPKLNYEMYVKRVEGRKLLDVEFRRRDPKKPGTFDLVARAREAELNVHMQKGQVLVKMRHCYVVSREPGNNGYDAARIWPVDLPEELVGQQKKFRASDMTWDELHEEAGKKARDIEGLEVEIALTASRLALSGPPDGLSKHLANLRQLRRQRASERLNLELERIKRPAEAFGCLCFVLVGCPVGIWFSRSDYLSAFITCFLPIVFLYYPLMLCGLNVARGGRVPPILSIWGADLLMGLIALMLFRRLLRN
ncbi:MAG: LptF/LptG family permease [Gemmataceae bacterium]|nr:LptF/LptG family permease [Gemmataceae bacterium]